MKVVIIGGGKVGSYIAKLLLDNNISVKVIEQREDIYEKLKSELPLNAIVFGNGTDPNVLESAGIAQADVVAAVTGADETNLVASTITKFEYNIPRVIARVNNPKNAWLFNVGMGVDVGLNQADLMAHLVVEEIDFTSILTLMKINHGSYSIVQVKVEDHSEAVQKAVSDLPIPSTAVLIAIYRGKDVIIPHGDTIIGSGDNILAFADTDAQITLNKIFGSVK
ncbi:MAG: NAD-binding protein [Eubacteriales bacterium]